MSGITTAEELVEEVCKIVNNLPQERSQIVYVETIIKLIAAITSYQYGDTYEY